MAKTIKLNVLGMTCKSCSKKIEDGLTTLNGVKSVKVDLLNNQVKITFDQTKLKENRIKKKIKDLGYRFEGETKDNSLKNGIISGLIPHIGCIAFIIGAIFGSAFIMKTFKPLMLNPYFFYILILISVLFATISAVLYLRKNGFLSLKGIKRQKGYLTTLYSITIGINLLLFFVIFPFTANATISPSNQNLNFDDISKISLKVNIPCPGHAPLISSELKTLGGISNIDYSFPNKFNVEYDSTQTTKKDILALEVFKSYLASVLSEG